MARAPFPDKTFKSYQQKHEILDFQLLRKMWQTFLKRGKKRGFFLIPDFLLFVVAAKFMLSQTGLLRLDAPG